MQPTGQAIYTGIGDFGAPNLPTGGTVLGLGLTDSFLLETGLRAKFAVIFEVVGCTVVGCRVCLLLFKHASIGKKNN
jgi:hypothetical protein